MTPKINQKYNWKAERLEVVVKNIREKFKKEIIHSDGSVSAARTNYSVEVEFFDKGEKVSFWTPWASASFEEIS